MVEGVRLNSINPATESSVWSGVCASSQDVLDAVNTAKTSFFDWARTSFAQRQGYCERIQFHLQAHRDALASCIVEETGKTSHEASLEVAGMINKITISIQAFLERCPVKTHHADRRLLHLSHRPHGVVCVLGPFNFPGHLPMGHMIPALLAGNTIVFKPSEYAPKVGAYLYDLILKSGLPKGVVTIVQGGKDVGRLLTAHPDISGVFFTGSSVTGAALQEQFAKRPSVILALELGGNNPLLISKLKDKKASIFGVIQSAFASAGQRCTSARRLIIVENTLPTGFLSELAACIQCMKVGGDLGTAFMGPLISESARQRVLERQSYWKQKGGAVLVESKPIKPGFFLTPSLIDITGVDASIDEECFGPLLTVQRVTSFEEGLRLCNQTGYGLSASLFSTSQAEFEAFFYSVKAGVVNWNTPTTGASSLMPFGGCGRSGNFRPGGYYAADYCAYPVSSSQSESLVLPEIVPPGLSL